MSISIIFRNSQMNLKSWRRKKENMRQRYKTWKGKLTSSREPFEALKKESDGIIKEMKEQETKISTRKKQLGIEKVGKVSVIESAIATEEKLMKAINEFEKVIVAKRDLEDFKEAVDELALRSGDFEKAKSEVELRYKGTSIRKDCDALSEQLNSYEDAIQKSETKINSYKNQLEELNRQQSKIEIFFR